jgi:UDP-3-O-[3-hydroxymyristoyl] glucosamine N-acyltransferase
MPKKSSKNDACLKLREIARLLGCPFEGDGDMEIRGAASLERAQKGDIVFLAQEKYRELLEKSEASAAIVPLEGKYERIPVIRAENPYLAFIRVISLFFKPYRPQPGIHSSAQVARSAKIGKDVAIGALASIGEDVEIGAGTVIFPFAVIYPRVKIGEETVIYSHVSIREDVRIGNRVIIHCGAVIGSDGFGYVKAADGTYIKVPQKGRVVIEDDVEIGANTTVDRAALEETVIRKGTKIDNLVMVAHNVEIGSDCILAGQTGIAGSSKIGKNVVMAGQVGIADHVNIGDNVIIAAKSGITKAVPAGSFIAGSPHLDIRDWRKVWVLLPQLYDLVKDMKRMKKELEELKKGKT